MPVIKEKMSSSENGSLIGKTAKLNKEVIMQAGPYENNGGIKIIHEKGDVGTVIGLWHQEKDQYPNSSQTLVFQCGNTKYLLRKSDLDFTV